MKKTLTLFQQLGFWTLLLSLGCILTGDATCFADEPSTELAPNSRCRIQHDGEDSRRQIAAGGHS